MPLYQYANLKLSSEITLDSLAAVRRDSRDRSSDFLFSFSYSPPIEPTESDWVHHWRTTEGDPTLSLATQGQGYLLRFPSLADFVISPDCREIGAWPYPGTNNGTLEHLLLDQVLPRLLGHRGLVVLHASAVNLGSCAVAFAGDTGRGKSTLAASFHTAGYPALCDDGLVITPGESFSTAQPIYPGLRLWPESLAAFDADTLSSGTMAGYSKKRRVAMNDQNGSEPVPLDAIFILAPPPREGTQGITVERLSTRDGCIALMKNSFRLHLNSPKHIADMLSITSAIASQTSMFSLNYPREFSSLADVHVAVTKHIKRLLP